ncbi:hypothetical protein F5B18DRAFT_298852 [Nemania serpens]|nr:hypothetical protein F5B18DRAFT_298852 [Nemania serpens]
MTSYLTTTRPPAITTATTTTTTTTTPPYTTTQVDTKADINAPSSSSSSSPSDDGDDNDGDDNDSDDNNEDGKHNKDNATPRFPRFVDLPPELRHQIWRAALPSSPGINFFNVHCFPNDHAACSRSASPPWSYLDLRRLSVSDADAAVSRYDPSSWQARSAARQSCREAREICAIPGHKAANVTLTRPRRGLFVRAADGQLRTTPLRVVVRDRERDRDGDGGGGGDGNYPSPLPEPEPVVRRIVQVHVDDILCLSVENCSFNLPFEDAPSPSSFPARDGDDDDDDDDDHEEGWAYDPQLTPALPRCIPADRLCANLALWGTGNVSLRFAADALFGLLYAHIPGYLELPPGELWPGRLLLMFDALVHHQDTDERGREGEEVVWDRFGDRYVRLPWQTEDSHPPPDGHGDGLPLMSRLMKVSPETSDIRRRYLASARLRSPKRLARSS